MMKTNFLLLQVRGKPQGSAYTWNTPFFDLQFVNIRTKKGRFCWDAWISYLGGDIKSDFSANAPSSKSIKHTKLAIYFRIKWMVCVNNNVFVHAT